MSWLLRLYPPAWQRRYRREVAAHLQAGPHMGWRTALDLIAGAVDAWSHPESIPESPTQTGERNDMVTACRLGSTDISTAAAARSGGWMIGVTLLLTTLGVTLDKTLGDHFLIDALLHSAFFIALMISSNYTFLRPYSRNARAVIMTVGSLAWYGFFAVVGYIAYVT